MRLAEDRLDVGLLTDEVGLGDHEVLPMTPAVTQHRFDVDGSVIKVNLVDDLDVERRGGYAEEVIAAPLSQRPCSLVGPDVVAVTVGPPGHRGVDQLGVRLRVPDQASARRYFADTLGWDVDGVTARLGASVVLLDEDADAPTAVEMPVRGWTYLTVQVHDCDAETDVAVARGAVLVQPPTTMGDVARFSMVADPWGNQLEISQKATLTGPLPTDDRSK